MKDFRKAVESDIESDEIKFSTTVYHMYCESTCCLSAVFNMTFVNTPEPDDIVVTDSGAIETWKAGFAAEIVKARLHCETPGVKEWLRDMEASRFIPGEREILVKRPV